METYSLVELTEAADVSPRTVRYYIAEGLLPPPEGAGPRATYTREHLDRLLLIGRLKEAFLPLREIRRRLNGLEHGEIIALLEQGLGMDRFPSAPAQETAVAEDAAEYISTVLDRSRNRSRRSHHTSARHVRDPDERISFPGASPWRDDQHDREVVTQWRRIRLGPDAELFVREEAYSRKRDRIEWLVNWAKRVFD
jgi:DNA-binding transcriptional MerR regulator